MRRGWDAYLGAVHARLGNLAHVAEADLVLLVDDDLGVLPGDLHEVDADVAVLLPARGGEFWVSGIACCRGANALVCRPTVTLLWSRVRR